ncbi:MAG: hypothetical protein JJ863_08390 [Deltaproteobacteria bacterium]|nr:hypothetical protein [Deltaproteobacteria bacterium]
MQPPSLGPKDLVYYGAFMGGTIAGYFVLTQFLIGGIVRTIGAIAIGWALGFAVDRIIGRGKPDE